MQTEHSRGSMNMIQEKLNLQDKYATYAVDIFLLYTFYYDLWDKALHNYLRTILFIISLFFIFFSLYTKDKHILIKKSFMKYIIGWSMFFSLFFLFRNRWIENHFYWRAIRILWSLLIIFCLSKSINRFTNLYKRLVIIGYPHVIATILLFLFRNTYSVMYRFWGYYPDGTGGGKYGFRAGLTGHYSRNGIMISIVFLCCFAYSYYYRLKKEKSYFPVNLLTFISFLSLLLTMKRAHILFSLFIIAVIIFLFQQQLSIEKIIRGIVFTSVLTALFLLLYNNVPEMKILLSRFQKIGEDSSSVARFNMWKAALSLFESNPIIGVGWGAFRYLTAYNVEAHNVYIELLAETGITGFVIYTTCLYNTLKILFIVLKRSFSQIDKNVFVISVASFEICLFYAIYSLTGNCLYDITFDFFVFPIASAYFLQYEPSFQW